MFVLLTYVGRGDVIHRAQLNGILVSLKQSATFLPCKRIF